MRYNFLLLIACLLLGACASEDLAVTGIPRARAIAIATMACKEYPEKYSYADRAKWIREGGYWRVDITDKYGEHGRFYMIDRHGKIIGKGRIPEEGMDRDETTYREHRRYDRDYDNDYYHGDPYYYDHPYRHWYWY